MPSLPPELNHPADVTLRQQASLPIYAPERPRLSAALRGYDRAWQRRRLNHLRSEPLCRMCKTEGRVSLAEEVDHITPISAGGSRLDDNNLQSLYR